MWGGADVVARECEPERGKDGAGTYHVALLASAGTAHISDPVMFCARNERAFSSSAGARRRRHTLRWV